MMCKTLYKVLLSTESCVHKNNQELEQTLDLRLERAQIGGSKGKDVQVATIVEAKWRKYWGNSNILVWLRRLCVWEEEAGVERKQWGYKGESLKECGFQSKQIRLLLWRQQKMKWFWARVIWSKLYVRSCTLIEIRGIGWGRQLD